MAAILKILKPTAKHSDKQAQIKWQCFPTANWTPVHWNENIFHLQLIALQQKKCFQILQKIYGGKLQQKTLGSILKFCFYFKEEILEQKYF